MNTSKEKDGFVPNTPPIDIIKSQTFEDIFDTLNDLANAETQQSTVPNAIFDDSQPLNDSQPYDSSQSYTNSQPYVNYQPYADSKNYANSQPYDDFELSDYLCNDSLYFDSNLFPALKQ